MKNGRLKTVWTVIILIKNERKGHYFYYITFRIMFALYKMSLLHDTIKV